ncbi:hypothetical protein [Pinibacter aurantiacus]|uniref:RiboL-PSP-HEPN domain-containing protein n=1 Tax=Pinibacter aurantiacus TaxID=2851599 RepID=A0A9E2W4H2_9BACT|nr:hypothetical protein [Pinibacter aurantiacus]MBV4357814.1 hypothetical protein [Pinibacter aurantiacus]
MTQHSLTVGQLLDALKIEIFDKSPQNDFQRKCLERETSLKHYIDVCGIIVHQLVEMPGLSHRNISHWKKAKAKECIENLVNYTEELINELDRKKIENYCRRITSSFLPFSRNVFEPDITLLTLNSYYGVILTDVYWIPDLTIYEAMQIAGGNLKVEELGKRTPSKKSQINQLLKNNPKIFQIYRSHLNTIDEAFKCYDKNINKAFNLLLLTSIEGLTRQLGQYLVSKQNLDVNVHSDKYNSLDAFLRKIPWKEEIKISKTRLALLTSHYKSINYNDPLVDLPKPFEEVFINLKTRLDFLRRRFKENRDLVLHGQETDYDKPYNGYINSSALYEVLETILKCHKIHENK